jgi:hypothetical protein
MIAQLAQRTADLAACAGDTCLALEDLPPTGPVAKVRARRR